MGAGASQTEIQATRRKSDVVAKSKFSSTIEKEDNELNKSGKNVTKIIKVTTAPTENSVNSTNNNTIKDSANTKTSISSTANSTTVDGTVNSNTNSTKDSSGTANSNVSTGTANSNMTTHTANSNTGMSNSSAADPAPPTNTVASAPKRVTVLKLSPTKAEPTQEQMQQAQELALKRIREFLAKSTLSLSTYKSRSTQEISEEMMFHRKTYSAMFGAQSEFVQSYRLEVSKLLIADGRFVPLVCEISVEALKKKTYLNDDGQVIKEVHNLLETLFICTMNYTDCADVMRRAFCQHEEFVKMIADKLLELFPKHKDGTLIKEEESYVKRMIGVAHNMAILSENVPIMRSHGYVKACEPYLDSSTELHKLSAVATLADLVNEDECDMLNSNEGSIKFMLKKLSNASKRANRRDAGWSAAELGRTVGRLARNDGNKKLLVELGCLPLLLTLIVSEVKVEREEAMESLWVLAFDDVNKQKMVSEPNLIETIERIGKTSTGKMKKMSQGIFWTLQKTLRNEDQFKHLVKTVEKKKEETNKKYNKAKEEKVRGHVMISYQWDHQAVLKQVSSSLRENSHQVWMDIDNMEGSTLQAMASAIEGAEAVVICMSQKYKDSPNCRAEAEYAFQLRRPIIPLIMERGYRPDGWLGFILGAKLFYDFSGKYSFETRIDGLMKAVKQVYDPIAVVEEEPKPNLKTATADEVDSPVIQKQKSKIV
ncbi:uncharacterized protein LOC126822433 isoform X2 [Patella vulgata]|uniref:uncharacterized protein LOC126822433 isoform X2 n=1 Tax=Patella vulgata TaxID=6465 RepID=UPI00217FA70C|nr:uncharacterized protein LOC126822433 isoform X2 [Patella vulgata]